MTILKCKMCGGTLDLKTGETVAECPYCGTKQTVPNIDDNKKAQMFDRANRLRSACSFDRALTAYENIIGSFPDEAEAYWGELLCKYGIEYVDDPPTGKKIPTCHRSSYDSVLEDEAYEMTMELASPDAKQVYREEAKRIEEIRKGINSVSAREEPYDIFICYKETDDKGERSIDSVIAQDVYEALTEKGYRVFFSRITLEDKIGKEYEPYIFAALNSAKVMLVFGTEYDHFNAVWVKNEWSRYLDLMSKDRSKVLIPCFRNMDVYDLPKEFAKFQAQDMGKVGSIQDLVRGISKLISPKKPITQNSMAMNGGFSYADTSALMKRAYMFLEDGEWDKADEFCEQVLNHDPENALAYLCKLMAELQVKKINDLKNYDMPFDESKNFQKVIRFGDDELVATLKRYNTSIKERIEKNQIEDIYNNAISLMNDANTEMAFNKAAELFDSVLDYQDSRELAEKCLVKAEHCKKDASYISAVSMMDGRNISDYESAMKIFESIPDWKDSAERAEQCRLTIEKIKGENEKELHRQERLIKRRRRVVFFAALAIAVVAAFTFLFVTIIQPKQKLNRAIRFLDNKNYIEADLILNELKSNDVILSERYDSAEKYINDCKYVEAYILLNGLNYKDSEKKVNEILDIPDIAHEPIIMSAILKRSLSDASVGSMIRFGSYKQFGNTGNVNEDLSWIVLAKEKNRILVISEYGLSAQPFHVEETDVTWETSSLRKWLNTEFYDTAFTPEEQAVIKTSIVTADVNPEYNVHPGNDVQDKVFLLSISEANQFFDSNEERIVKATSQARNQGAYSDHGYSSWWLRSTGDNERRATYVDSDGILNLNGSNVSISTRTVRPALWIEIN